MKTIFASFVLISSLSAMAQTRDRNGSLASITNPKIIVTTGGGIAAVQPTATLRFDFASCAKFDLKFKKTVKRTDSAEMINVLSVFIPMGQMDCMGPTTNRTYSFQISSDARFNDKYVLANPIAPESR